MQGQKPQAFVFPIGDDCYANARVDAALVTAIAGSPRAPFWLSTHTHTIRWMRHAFAFTGKRHPTLEEILYSVTGCGTDFLQWKWAEMDRAVGEVAA